MQDAAGGLGQAGDTAVTKKPHWSWSEVVIYVGIVLVWRQRTIWREKFEKEGKVYRRHFMRKVQIAPTRIKGTIL